MLEKDIKRHAHINKPKKGPPAAWTKKTCAVCKKAPPILFLEPVHSFRLPDQKDRGLRNVFQTGEEIYFIAKCV